MEPKIINNLVVVWTSGFPTHSINNNTNSLNLVQDVLSSQLLFEFGVAHVYLPGYHVGAQLTLSLPDMKEFVKGRGDIGNYLYELYTNNPLHKQRGVTDQTWRTWVIWDVINIAWMIEPSWVPSHVVSSPVLNNELYWRRDTESYPMREAYGVNRDAIFYDFFKKIDKLKLFSEFIQQLLLKTGMKMSSLISTYVKKLDINLWRFLFWGRLLQAQKKLQN